MFSTTTDAVLDALHGSQLKKMTLPTVMRLSKITITIAGIARFVLGSPSLVHLTMTARGVSWCALLVNELLPTLPPERRVAINIDSPVLDRLPPLVPGPLSLETWSRRLQLP